jgi:chemotaxis protein CheX
MPGAVSLAVVSPHVPGVVAGVFQTMLDVHVEVVEAGAPLAGDLATSAVLFAGEWHGAVVLECPIEHAFELTRRLMKIPRPSALDDDVRDTLGELANMVAGNLKGVMPQGVALSMPTVVAGSDYSLRLCGVVAREAWRFAGDGVQIEVVVLEMADARPRHTRTH